MLHVLGFIDHCTYIVHYPVSCAHSAIAMFTVFVISFSCMMRLIVGGQCSHGDL